MKIIGDFKRIHFQNHWGPMSTISDSNHPLIKGIHADLVR